MDVTLEAMLAARDARAARQRQLLARFKNACLITFTVVTPGAAKRTPESERLFRAGLKALGDFLRRYELVPLRFETNCPETGYEAYLVLKTEPSFLKMELCKLEASAPYGRLWDFDVLDSSGKPVAREDVGLPPRGCIVCGKPGRACASRQLHPTEDVLAACHKLLSTLPEDA